MPAPARPTRSRERHGVEAHVGDGQVKAAEFEALKRRFTAGEFPVLCLSRIGHEGHNLQNASVLTHLDLPWLPTGLEQRVGRAARPGAAKGWVQTYIPYIRGGGVEHIVSVLAPRGAEHHQILDSFEGVRASESTIATQLGAITGQVADSKDDAGLRRHRRPPAGRRQRLRRLTEPRRARRRTADLPSQDRKEVALMSAINAALDQIDRVAEEGDLTPPTRRRAARARDARRADPAPGRQADLPAAAARPADRRARLRAARHGEPRRVDVPAADRPARRGKSQIARAVAYRLWQARGREVQCRHGVPFYGFVELAGGPSSDEYLFRHEFVPAADDAGSVRLVDSAFVQAMREGWVVMIDEVNTIRDVALLSINSCFDGRLSLYLPATGQTVTARPGFACLLAYNPGLVGATDIPDAWHSRFPATLEVTSNWPALVELGAARRLVGEAAALDRQRIAGEDGLCWTPQFRDIEALSRMIDRVGERAALAFFVSNLLEQVQAGKLQDAEAAAACRMLDQAGYAHLKVSATGRVPNLHGYPRAVTS